VLFERYLLFTPLLAVIAAAALFAFIARLSLRWSPDGRIAARGFVLPGVWGMVGAPLTAMVAQVITAVMLVSGGVAGLYLADAALMDSIDEWIVEAAELTDLSIMQTPTIAAGMLAMLGIVAPLTEEVAKFLGVYIVFRNRVATKLGVFLAGASAGLGFAVVETLGYALMAVDQWPQVMLIRAPVAFIHVAATTIVALGWYKQRESGGFWLASFFVLSVLLHGAWNALFVSMLIVAGDVTTTDAIDPATALTTLAIVSAMGAVLVAAVMWIIGNARRLGRESISVRESSGTASVVNRGTAGASSY
jgi:RsiW-degrading membrane proteinase PrsW (M82 family)